MGDEDYEVLREVVKQVDLWLNDYAKKKANKHGDKPLGGKTEKEKPAVKRPRRRNGQ